MKFLAKLIPAFVFCLLVLAQPTAVATFDGVFKSADKRFVEIQVESGDIMRMYLTHGTKFIRKGRDAKVSDFHDGDKVVADATRDARLNLVAVKIEMR